MRNYFKKLYILLFFVFNIINAQDPYFIKYSIEEGLPTSNIYSALEDSNGYIWFATDVGVLRYDGYDFKHFNTDSGLGDNEVFKIYEDSKHRLWFLTLNGKTSYYKKGKFYNELNDSIHKKLSHPKMIIDIYEDKNQGVHFLFKDGFISMIDINQKVTLYKNKGTSSFSIWKDSINTFVLTHDAIVNVTKNEREQLLKDMLSNYGYRTFIKGGEVFFASKNAVYNYKEENYNKIFTINNDEIIYLSKIQNKFWIGTKTGLVIKEKNKEKNYFKNDIVSSIILDSQNNYWITTLNNGIKFIPNFKILKYTFSKQNVKVTALNKDTNRNLWIGTENGLFLNKDNIIKRLNKENSSIKKIREFNGYTYALSDKISVYNNYIEKKPSLIAINDIYMINDKNYLIGTSSLTFKFDRSEFYWLKNISLNLPKNRRKLHKRTNVIEKGENNLYIGTSTGLYNYSNKRFAKMKFLNEELNTTILDLYYNKEYKKLVVASNSKGISILKNDTIIHHIDKAEGLNSNGCNSIKKFKEDSYFVGTNKGLNLISIVDNNFKVFDFNTLYHFKNERINDIEIIKNKLYLATNTGLLLIDIDEYKIDKIAPKLLIDKILINGVQNSELNNLSHEENDLTIYFTGISYKDYGDLEYEYKFNGDKKWTSTKSREITFKNLPFGSYSIDVRTKGRNNLYSSVKSILFTIKPPLWKTYPFILLIIFAIIILIFYFIKRRINSINSKFRLENRALEIEKERTILEKQTIELEQKALRLQMNPHFMFNALNTIKGYYSGGNIKEANLYISKFSKLLRLILENNEQLISLNKEIEMLELYIKLIQLRYQDVFDYVINVDDSIDRDELIIPPLLIQPIVENAIIHGLAPSKNQGKLRIYFFIDKDKLVCSIKDNGIGIINLEKNKSVNHKSKAIKITKERISFINNSSDVINFEIKDLKPSGTEVILRVPYNIYINESSNYRR